MEFGRESGFCCKECGGVDEWNIIGGFVVFSGLRGGVECCVK